MGVKVNIKYVPRRGQKVAHSLPKKFKLIVAHRRWGKSHFACADMLIKGMTWLSQGDQIVKMRYIAPTYGMAKDIAWETLKLMTLTLPGDAKGTGGFYKKYDNSNLIFEWGSSPVNKMVIALKGADNPDSLRGSGIKYNVLDEFQNMKADIWDKVVYPTTLDDDNSHVLIIGTPMGRNKFYTLYQQALGKSSWDVMKSDIYTSGVFPRDEDNPLWKDYGDEELSRQKLLQEYERIQLEDPSIVKPASIEDIKAEIWDDEGPEAFQQEFELSWSPSVKGSVFGEQLSHLKSTGRYTRCPVDPRVQVSTAWDLGINDKMVVIFFQKIGSEVRIVDFLAASNKSLNFFISYVLQWGERHGVVWGKHLAPHDIQVRELTTGTSRYEIAMKAGLHFTPVPRCQKKADAINAGRTILPRVIIHDQLQDLVDNLQSYHFKWDDIKGQYSNEPVHDSSSNYADAFMTMAQGEAKAERRKSQTIIRKAPRPYA